MSNLGIIFLMIFATCLIYIIGCALSDLEFNIQNWDSDDRSPLIIIWALAEFILAILLVVL